jgi:glutamate carboxypeptidase
MIKNLDKVKKYIDDHRDEMIQTWKEIVQMESYAREPEKVDMAGQRLKSEFEKTGMTCKLVDAGANGKSLVGILGEDRKGDPVVFSGHFDTVFPSGSFGDELFKIEDGKAHGPGALDMKGGIVIALYVIKALNHIGYDERPLKIVLSGDEEIGHLNSTGAEIIMREAKGAVCAFNMETGLLNNDLCIGRKGRVECHITVNGVESHAGNDFSSGRSAIEEMAHKIIEIQKLTDLGSGTTVSVGKIKGGTVSNAVPALCKIEIDIRFEKDEQMNLVMKQLEEISSRTYVDGTSTLCEFVNAMPAYETTQGVLSFFDYVNRTAKEYGFPEMGGVSLGGSSDASFITKVGTPVICSFGVRGKWNHTLKEYAVVESMFERAKLISAVVLNLTNFS